MRSPLSHQDLDQRPPAGSTGLTLPTIDLKLVLVGSWIALRSDIEPVKGRSLPLDCLFQDLLDHPVESLRPGLRNPTSGGQRVQSRLVQGLVHVDVPKAREECLIQKQGLHVPLALTESLVQPRGSKGIA